MAHREYPRNLPSIYASEKVAAARSRLSGPLGAAIQRATSVVAPGVPSSAWLGFASNGERDEVTEANELGYFGIEGARLSRLQRDPDVVRILGRTSTDWHPESDQAAMGIVNVLDHASDVFAQLPALVRPSSPSSPWNVAIGIFSWSSPTNARRAVARHAEHLVALPEEARWRAFYRMLAADARAGLIPLANDHSSEAYTALRTQQKIEVARSLGSSFFGPSDPQTDEVLARLVVGQFPDADVPTDDGAAPYVLAEAGFPASGILVGLVAGVVIVEILRRRKRLLL